MSWSRFEIAIRKCSGVQQLIGNLGDSLGGKIASGAVRLRCNGTDYVGQVGTCRLSRNNNAPISNRPQDAILDAILPHKSRFKDLVAQTIGFALCPDW